MNNEFSHFSDAHLMIIRSALADAIQSHIQYITERFEEMVGDRSAHAWDNLGGSFRLAMIQLQDTRRLLDKVSQEIRLRKEEE